MGKQKSISEIDLTRWEEYDDIITDSLWLLGKRDNSGTHSAEYWGNFIPQIPHQAMRRFTKPGELVIDPFMGMGTTLIEAVRLGRYAIGVDIHAGLVEGVKQRVEMEEKKSEVQALPLVGDSTQPETIDKVKHTMRTLGFSQAHLLILHPPYHDILRFSDHPNDLSNAPTLDEFLDRFERAVELYTPLLQEGRFLVLVIGDKYAKREWIPLGFMTMERVKRQGFLLKSLCIKDIQENRAKRGQYHLWRYRALKYNFYIFKHEYVMFFQKEG